MGEKANPASAVAHVLTHAGPVLGGMQPRLEHPMSILTRVSVLASTLPEIGARDTAIEMLSRVSPLRVLSRVGVWAFGPIVRISPRARHDFEGVHPECIGRVVYTTTTTTTMVVGI